jgi:chromosome segregation protein
MVSVDRLSADIPSLDPELWKNVTHFEEVNTFINHLAEVRTEIQNHFAGIRGSIEQLKVKRQTAETEFNTRFSEFKRRHDAASKEKTNLLVFVNESSQLQSELQEAQARERKSGARLTGLQDAEEKLRAARTRLQQQINNYRHVLGQAALKVSGTSDGMLRASVQTEVIPRQYVNALIDLCENSRVREAEARCEDRVKQTLMEGSGENWESFCDRLLTVSKSRLQAGPSSKAASSGSAALESLLFELTPQQSAGIYQNLTASRVSAILSATPNDYISFDYRDRNQHIPFQQASPGQQAAALLNLLLRQEAGTLIIDQPEDDLDNKVIMQIVRLLQTAKRKRQLIFATHNANFLVNGDADKVVALMPGVYDPSGAPVANADTPRISVEVDGAIETPNVQNIITDTVEGGRAAFQLRSRKYKFRH